VVDQNRERVEELRAQGRPAVFGDAADPAVLIQAHIARAALLVVATPGTVGVLQMIEVARTLNPGIGVVMRSHSEDEAALFERDAAARVFIGEQELAQAMVTHVLGAVTR
jgi:CPA2 family monovalent cation:H+ antiporter-2